MSSLLATYSPEVLVNTVLWVFRAYRAHGFNLTYWPAQLDTWVVLLEKHLSPSVGRGAYQLVDAESQAFRVPIAFFFPPRKARLVVVSDKCVSSGCRFYCQPIVNVQIHRFVNDLLSRGVGHVVGPHVANHLEYRGVRGVDLEFGLGMRPPEHPEDLVGEPLLN